MKKIVVLTGSFNPVTKAHYAVLSDAVKKTGADEGIFVATNDKYLAKKTFLKHRNPSGFVLSEAQRSEMLRSLSKENPKLSYWGVELGGVYAQTFKTVKKLLAEKQKQYRGEEIQLFFLLGADKMKNMPGWHHLDEFFEICEFLVYSRSKFDIDTVIEDNENLRSRREKIHLLTVADDDVEDISSTEVRRRFLAGEDYRDLMNDGPYRYMQTLDPKDYHAPTAEDVIKTQITCGGRFGGHTACTSVYKANNELFQSWAVPFLGDRDAHRAAKAYSKEFRAPAGGPLTVPTVFDCVNEDCVDVAKRLIDEGLNPAILNLASRTSPGGAYHKGGNAQEESLCQMSTLSQSLYQFGDPERKHIKASGTVNIPGVYPMDINFGGIYSPCVTFFRNNKKQYFSLRETMFDCPVITVASLSNRVKQNRENPERAFFDSDGHFIPEGREIEANKIRTIFRIALDNDHDSIVLGAFGCGAYRLFPEDVAPLFKEILDEPEFKNRFRKLVFAIYEGKPQRKNTVTGREGKFKPFYDLFG